jgi:peptidoglycan/xylan/chitin deacetylase (PgdA/CDA1 family)
MNINAIRHKLERRASRLLHRRVLDLGNRASVVSFTFDDMPRSACLIGADLIEEAAGAATFYVCGGLANQTDDFFQSRDLQDVSGRGHEIGSHGFRHLDYQRCTLSDIAEDLDLNDDYFKSIDLPIPKTFAFPYGSVSPRVKNLLIKRFMSLRGVQNAPNFGSVDRALLKAVHLYAPSFDLENIRQLVREATQRPTWLIFLIHGVSDAPGDFDLRTEQFRAAVSLIEQSQLSMMTMSSALAHFSGNSSSQS